MNNRRGFFKKLLAGYITIKLPGIIKKPPVEELDSFGMVPEISEGAPYVNKYTPKEFA